MFKKLTNTQTKLIVHIEIEKILCKKESTKALHIKFSRRELNEVFSFIPNQPAKISFEFVGTFFSSNNGIIEKLLTIDIFDLQHPNNPGSEQINLSTFAVSPGTSQIFTVSIPFNGTNYKITGNAITTHCRDRSCSPLKSTGKHDDFETDSQQLISPRLIRRNQNGIIQNSSITTNATNQQVGKRSMQQNPNGRELTKVASNENLRQRTVLFKQEKEIKPKSQSTHGSEENDTQIDSNTQTNDLTPRNQLNYSDTRRNRFN